MRNRNLPVPPLCLVLKKELRNRFDYFIASFYACQSRCNIIPRFNNIISTALIHYIKFRTYIITNNANSSLRNAQQRAYFSSDVYKYDRIWRPPGACDAIHVSKNTKPRRATSISRSREDKCRVFAKLPLLVSDTSLSLSLFSASNKSIQSLRDSRRFIRSRCLTDYAPAGHLSLMRCRLVYTRKSPRSTRRENCSRERTGAPRDKDIRCRRASELPWKLWQKALQQHQQQQAT